PLPLPDALPIWAHTATRMPAAASSRTIAAPIAPAPPVTTARLATAALEEGGHARPRLGRRGHRVARQTLDEVERLVVGIQAAVHSTLRQPRDRRAPVREPGREAL